MEKKNERKTLGNDNNRVGRRDIILPLSTVSFSDGWADCLLVVSTIAVHSINTIGGYTQIYNFMFHIISNKNHNTRAQSKLNTDWLVAFK